MSSIRKTILVIDDNPLHIELVEQMLMGQYRVIGSENPLSVLNLVLEHTPDLLLLDLSMPALDGHKVCRVLKRSDFIKKPPLIYIYSAADEEILEQKTKEAQADGYIQKGLNVSGFLQTVEKILS